MAIVVNLCVSFLLLQIIAAEQEESYCYTLSRILPCLDSPYRNIDGSCNNLKHPSWGKSYWPYRRLLPNRYANGKHELPKQKSGKEYPSPRVVSNTLMPVGDQKSKKYNTMQMSMGQIITHDLGLAAGTQVGANGNMPPPGCCTNNKYGLLSNTSICTDIPIPPGDPDYSEPGYTCLPFARTSTTKKYLCALFQKAEEQITEVTSYLDLSLVYGSTDQKMRELRTFSDGKLKSVMRNGQEFPPNVAMPSVVCVRATKPDAPCYSSGDERMNQNPPLTTLQVAWFRQHNKLVTALKSLNPHYSDEKTYQEARRMNIAMLQNIVFSEVLQDYLGLDNMVDAGLYFPNATGCVDDYDETLDATTHQEFATAGWRFFHSLIQGRFSSYNNKREFTQNISLADYIDIGSALEESDEVNYNTMLRGMTIQNDYLSDEYYEHSLKYQFAKDDQTGYGLDLISIDIQRERDHGLGSYCDARKYCKNPCPETFEELVPLISKENVEKMKTMYQTVNDIELYSGGILEENVSGGMAGPTFQCIYIDQFTRTRRGDRYFFENCEPHGFTEEQLKSIRSVTLARILCDNSDIDQCQPRATQIPGDDNQLINCTDLPYLNITLFRSKDSNIEYNDTFLEGVYRAFTKIVDKIKPSYVG